MEPHRQILIQTLADGVPEAFPVIHQFEDLRQRDEIYRWFIKNKITGKRFIHYCQERGLKKMSIASEILKKLYPSRKSGMTFGKDTF